MKTKTIYFIFLCMFLLLLPGCVHQKDVRNSDSQGSVVPVENPVMETESHLPTRRIEYTPGDELRGFREYSYNKDEQLIQETLYSRKGNCKETRVFEYEKGKLAVQKISNKNNLIVERREYHYSEDGRREEKTVKRNDNTVKQHHSYTFNGVLLEREDITVFTKDGEISSEYYYLFFYDGETLSRREMYDKNSNGDERKEMRKYVYADSRLIREEEFNQDGETTNYFIYTYGDRGIKNRPFPGSRLYEEIFSDDIFHEFIVEITREEWNGITRDMLDYAEKHPVTLLYPGDGRPYRTGKYRKADFIYRRPNGEEIVLKEVGIRTRGNESRRLPVKDGKYQKTHFKIKFDETFDLEKGTTDYKQKNKRRFAGMRALNFKWSRYNTYERYPNKTKINELFSYELLDKAGVTVPEMSLATLTFRIDGKKVDYGIYGIVEHIDKEFLKKRFGSDNDGDLYKCLYLGSGPHLTISSLARTNVGVKNLETNYRPIYDLKTNEKTSEHSDLKKFVNTLNSLQGDDFINYMEENFEVDKFLKFCAMGIYITNLDDYRFLANNYYLYFRNNGKIAFIPYDYDISLGTGWHGEMSYNEFINQDIFHTVSIPESWGDYSPRPLVDRLLKVNKYREQYIHYLKEYIYPARKLFLFSEYREKFEKLHSLYKGEDINDTSDRDPMGWHGYEADYFYDKTKNVLDQLKIPHDRYEIQ